MKLWSNSLLHFDSKHLVGAQGRADELLSKTRSALQFPVGHLWFKVLVFFFKLETVFLDVIYYFAHLALSP